MISDPTPSSTWTPSCLSMDRSWTVREHVLASVVQVTPRGAWPVHSLLIWINTIFTFVYHEHCLFIIYSSDPLYLRGVSSTVGAISWESCTVRFGSSGASLFGTCGLPWPMEDSTQGYLYIYIYIYIYICICIIRGANLSQALGRREVPTRDSCGPSAYWESSGLIYHKISLYIYIYIYIC